jgi:hypothetical protein
MEVQDGNSFKHSQVECTDGVYGRSVYVLINPVIDQMTHLVVKEDLSLNTEYIVPVDFVLKTIVNMIRLRCRKAELEKLDPFIKTTFIEEKVPTGSFGNGGRMYGMGSYYFAPYVTSEIPVQRLVEHQQIPTGELAVRRDARVKATDGTGAGLDN